MSDMTEQRGALRWLPALHSRWWTALLGLSLMLNLAIIGAVAGGFWAGRGAERLAGVSYVQLIPRNFFHDLPGERRKQLMQIVRDNRDELRNLRQASESVSLSLAEALEKPDFAIADVQKTVSEFSTGTQSLAARGGDVVVKIVSQLTPEERKLLASAIRERAARGERRKRE
jgi:uncharacterized membrane protein